MRWGRCQLCPGAEEMSWHETSRFPAGGYVATIWWQSVFMCRTATAVIWSHIRAYMALLLPGQSTPCQHFIFNTLCTHVGVYFCGVENTCVFPQRQLEDYLNGLLKMALYRKLHYTVSNNYEVDKNSHMTWSLLCSSFSFTQLYFRLQTLVPN